MFRSPFFTWLKRQSQVTKGRPARTSRDSRRSKLYLEVLEDRTLLSASVVDVSTTMAPNSIIGSGQTVTVNVDFSQAVNVTGTPKLALNDSAAQSGSFVGGSGTTSLQFSFVVPSGDTATPLDYSSTSALTLNSGTIVDASDSVAANLTLLAPGTSGFDLLDAHNLDIDGVAPTITNVSTTTAGGTLGTGQTVAIDLNLSKAVTVNTTNGTPTLTLNATNGINPVTATYNAGLSTSTQLVFTYTTQAGDTTSGTALDYAASGLNLHGGTIRDAANNALNPTSLPAPGIADSNDHLVTAGIVIDATTPAVTSVTTPTSTGTYGPGGTVVFDVNFGEAVTVNTTNGLPTLTLSDGKSATYNAGLSTSTQLVFTYTAASGDTTNGSALDVSGIVLNGATIKNAGGVAANLVIHGDAVAGTNIVIDATTPRVLIVDTSTKSGTYGTGATVTIALTFTEAVNVTGAPTLSLNDGGTASYASGSGTATLVFTYTVKAGDTTSGQALDSASTTALNLNGGTIKSAGGTAAVLTLPTPGGVNDILAVQQIVINAVAPTPTPSPTPTPAPSIQDQVRQLFQDLVSMQLSALTGNVPAFFQTLQQFESLLVTVEQEVFQIVLNYLSQGSSQALSQALSQANQAIEGALLIG